MKNMRQPPQPRSDRLTMDKTGTPGAQIEHRELGLVEVGDLVGPIAGRVLLPRSEDDFEESSIYLVVLFIGAIR